MIPAFATRRRGPLPRCRRLAPCRAGRLDDSLAWRHHTAGRWHPMCVRSDQCV